MSPPGAVVLTSEVLYLLFVPGFTLLAFLIGAGAAVIAMSARQEPAGDDATDAEVSHAEAPHAEAVH